MIKDRILNIILVILFIFGLFLGVNLLINQYKMDCYIYNKEIIDCSIGVIKGIKSVEDIQLLNSNNQIKEYLLMYYNNTFYTDNEKIVLYDDMVFWNENKNSIASMQLEYGDSILDEGCPYFLSTISDEELKFYSDEDLKYIELSNIYIDILKNQMDRRVFEEDNQICIYVSDLNFNELGEDEIIYKGLRFRLFANSLEKNVLSYHINSDIYQSIEVRNTIKTEDGYRVFLKNDYGSDMSILYNTHFGKIIKLEFNIKL